MKIKSNAFCLGSPAPNNSPGANADNVFSSAFAVDTVGGAALLLTLGSAMSHAMKFRMLGLVMASLFLLGATLGSSSNSDPAQQGIGGVWTGESTNGIFGTFMTIKLTTNGYGAVEYGGDPSDFGLPGTFTYLIAYNLTCYECQLGNQKRALQNLEEAIDLAGKKDIRQMALDDPDLEPIWPNIAEI